MGFVGVSRALYDYTPQADGELAIRQGDLLYILEKNGDDGWWKAKKRAGADDEDEPTGLIPNNYVQEADPVSNARAIYEYTRQTDEELSFPEDAVLSIFDVSDPDWILAGVDGDYGFIPSNYIDLQTAVPSEMSNLVTSPPTLPRRPPPSTTIDGPNESVQDSTSLPASISSAIQSQTIFPQSKLSPRFNQEQMLEDEPQFTEEDALRSPVLPSRPPFKAQLSKAVAFDQPNRNDVGEAMPTDQRHLTPGGFHMYNINEMVSVMGKKKKMPTTLGINLGTGTILIAPEKAQDDLPQEWTADKMTHYSREGKHIFMELVRPSKSIDFHAGAKDTAEEIVTALGELAGAARAEGLREVIMAGSQKRQKKGTVLYDFMAQGEDEVTVAAGDDVVIIDDSRSEEWWQVRRLKNGNEGVVPSSYIELTGTVTPPLTQNALTSIRDNQVVTTSATEENRVEEIRLTKDAMKASKDSEQVGPGMFLPKRGSSLMVGEEGNNLGKQRNRRDNGRHDNSGHNKTKAKPDASKIRTWTDRSKSFSVDAQFLGLKDGKIHLHKMNGVKIAVPITKMSREDLEYVEDLTGISLDDERPLADVKKVKPVDEKSHTVGATIDKSQTRPDYDWFQFFLSCDVAVGLCERYAQAFARDSMDESVLPDVDASVLRNLGLREGDIIKVMRSLDTKFGRDRNTKTSGDGDGSSGSLFSGPGGALRNNTRKGRPAPSVQTSDIVDAAAFSTNLSSGSMEKGAKSPLSSSPAHSPTTSGDRFEDDAWNVKPAKQEEKQQQPPTQALLEAKPGTLGDIPLGSSTVPHTLTEPMKDLSMLTAPLVPSKSEPTGSISSQNTTSNGDGKGNAGVSVVPPQPFSATSPSFFSGLHQSRQTTNHTHGVSAKPPTSPKALARQLPIPSSTSPPIPASLIPPPPQRPVSAPQSEPRVFAPPLLSPQLTSSIQGQVALPGQSLNDLNQVRLQQQYAARFAAMQPALAGFSGVQQPQAIQTYSSNAPHQFLQPVITGTSNAGGFTDRSSINQYSVLQSQPISLHLPLSQQAFGQHSPGNINNYLPPPIEPQRTGLSSIHLQSMASPSGFAPMAPQPLLPQQTGPPPPVRFGITQEAKKLAPQPTGRRANLAQATPQNPFGF